MSRGYTLAELLIVIAIIIILAVVSTASFVSRRNRSQLSTTVATMAGVLREAQSRSVSQDTGAAWGVHFDNGPAPFFALFTAPYSSSTLTGRHALPPAVGYATTSIASGAYAEILFTQISGFASGSSSIVLQLLQDPQASSTIAVASSGAVSY